MNNKNFTKHILKPYTWSFVLFFALMCMATLFSIASILSVSNFLQILFDTNTEIAENPSQLEIILNKVYDYCLSFGKHKALWLFAAIIFVIYFLKDLFTYLGSYFMGSTRNKIIRNIRNSLFEQFSTQTIGFIAKFKKGDLLSRVSNDITEYEQNVLQSIQTLIVNIISVLMYFAVLLYIDYKITLLVLVVFPPVAGIVSFFSRKLKRSSKHMQQKSSLLTSILEETISSLRIIKSFNAIDEMNKRFQNFNTSYTRLRNKINRRVNLASPQSEFFGNCLVIGILLVGARNVICSPVLMSADMFIVYLIIFSLIIKPAKDISTSFYNIKKADAAKKRICEIIYANNTIVEPENPIELEEIKNGISINNLNFSYDAKTPVLKNINLFFKKGENTAIVGASGSGKSTLIDLIMKFYNTEENSILFDDIPLCKMHSQQVRKHIAIVTQETILFNDSVKNNISFGDNSYSEEEIIQAAKIANAHEFISNLPQGYDTIIGDRGCTLSGGQKQRLAIARAILRKCEILILDEATSALDTISEHSVQEAINHLSKEKTIITIAHRLSTIKNCDKIIVMDNGCVKEIGKHSELIAQNGIYHKLCKMQEIN
ncbi:MAG: ABC transporter ATP-binding protein [Bacteroidales bacterium]|nr:ABC transporter ATP-binding protein [Bacteroidales bacterium]